MADRPDILTAKLRSCCCSSVSGHHAAVEVSRVELSTENAVAISYTWGEFDRRDVCIGHHFDNVATKISLNLGQEWTVPELIDRLIEICDQSQAIWMDQLCLPQKDEEIRSTLAKIPSIYGTLDVIILFPGSLCGCLRKSMAEFKSTSDFDSTIQNMLMRCHNTFGFCSWPNRVWPSQELTNSRLIRIVWNSKKELSCVPVVNNLQKDDFEHMNPYARLLAFAVQAELGGPSSIVATHMLIDAASDFLYFCAHTLLIYGGKKAPSGSSGVAKDAMVEVIEFLLGKHLYNTRPPPSKDTKVGSLQDYAFFLQTLGNLSSSPKSATQMKDYVLSIWSTCPNYVVPTNFRAMGLLDLLSDAVIQLESSARATLASYAPAGLFRGRETVGQDIAAAYGGAWRPTTYIDPPLVTSTSQIYGVLPFNNFFIRLARGFTPLRVWTNTTTSTIQRAENYQEFFQEWSISDVLRKMFRLKQTWSNRLIERIAFSKRISSKKSLLWAIKSGLVQSTHESDRDLLTAKAEIEFALDIVEGKDPEEMDDERTKAQEEERRMEVDHHQIMYEIVAEVLGLEASVCQEKGLELVVALDEPVRIGLSRISPKEASVEGHSAMIKDPAPVQSHGGSPAARDFLTIWMGEDFAEAKGDEPLLEAIKVTDNAGGPPIYQVIGTWVPGNIREEEIGGIPTFGACEAFLS